MDMCDICAGNGKPISGKPCICGGAGTLLAEMQGFRKALYKAYDDLDVCIKALEYYSPKNEYYVTKDGPSLMLQDFGHIAREAIEKIKHS